ncbi:MAG: hypothetical protein ACUZ8E_12655 [Candidatus Anammoxibacter sp.]
MKQIRRYMSFSKFLSVIDKGLFLPKASMFEDKWEALLPYGESISSADFETIKRNLEWIYVSCWTKEPLESYAMWQIYGKESLSVAITTTEDHLKSAYLGTYTKTQAYLSEVKYHLPGTQGSSCPPCVDVISNGSKDLKTYVLVNMNFLYRKHKTYVYENEVRLAALDANPSFGIANKKEGIVLDIASISGFMESVIISPNTPDSFLETVQNVVNKTKWDIIVKQSSLNFPLINEEEK